jgi:hypothetical protein
VECGGCVRIRAVHSCMGCGGCVDAGWWAMKVLDYEDGIDINAAIADGNGVVFYEFNYRTANARYSEAYPGADVWYTERNGDPITLLVPKGTPTDLLPDEAKGYLILEWINPDKDFGTGYQIDWRKRRQA